MSGESRFTVLGVEVLGVVGQVRVVLSVVVGQVRVVLSVVGQVSKSGI